MNCWWLRESAMVCADWMKPRTRSEYFSIFISCLQSVCGPLCGAGQAKVTDPLCGAGSKLQRIWVLRPILLKAH